MSNKDPDLIFATYKQKLREFLRGWEVPEASTIEIINEIESHIAEGRKEGRDLADILKGLGPVDQLAEAYGVALVFDSGPQTSQSKVQKLRSMLSRKLWIVTLTLLFCLVGLFSMVVGVAGMAGLAAAVTLPYLPVEVLEPTLRAGTPQLVLIVLSLFLLTLGWLSIRWLRVNTRLVRATFSKDSLPFKSKKGEAPAQGGKVRLHLVRENSGRKLSTLGVILCGALLSHELTPAFAEEVLFERSISVVNQSLFELDMGNGEISVYPSDDKNIHIRFEGKIKRFTGDEDIWNPLAWFLSNRLEDENSLLDAIDIQINSEDDRIRVRPLPRGRTRTSRISESWSIALPADFTFKLDAISAQADIRGISGGITVDQGHGNLLVYIPEGDLDLNLEVGNIVASSGTQAWRTLTLETEVGNVDVRIDGRRMDLPNPPGPGNKISLEGRGNDVVKLEVTVGDAQIRFE